MPCPFWDQWSELNVIAAGHTSLKWLWSVHNEHRIPIPRLLMLLDLKVFGGKNVSLFVEIYLVQIGEWLGLYLFLERCARLPRKTLFPVAGLFAFCIFHPNQAENFTWAFQVSFVLPFALGTLSLLAIAYLECFRRRMLVVAVISLMPLIAAMNLSGGLLIGPFTVSLAMVRGVSPRYVLLLLAVWLLSVAVYLTSYHIPADDPLWRAHPKDIFVYLLTYLGASWTKIVPHKERVTCFLSFVVLGWIIWRSAQRRAETPAVEWFCIVECLWIVATAVLTSLGRLQDGVGQAYGGRYQTAAMLYWAALGSLLILHTWRCFPRRSTAMQTAIAALMFCSVLTMPRIWSIVTTRGDRLAQACAVVMHGPLNRKSGRVLYSMPQEMPPDIAYLHRLWRD